MRTCISGLLTVTLALAIAAHGAVFKLTKN